MLHEMIERYCKCKRIKMIHTKGTYLLNHCSDKVVITVNREDVTLNYENTKVVTEKDTLITTLNKEIQNTKQLNTFSNTSKPKKWIKNQHRNKIIEYGREYMFEYTMKQNSRFINKVDML